MQKIDIKMEHNFMNIITYKVRHNELVVPLNLMQEFEQLLTWRSSPPGS
jgi:hypothetical protein